VPETDARTHARTGRRAQRSLYVVTDVHNADAPLSSRRATWMVHASKRTSCGTSNIHHAFRRDGMRAVCGCQRDALNDVLERRMSGGGGARRGQSRRLTGRRAFGRSCRPIIWSVARPRIALRPNGVVYGDTLSSRRIRLGPSTTC